MNRDSIEHLLEQAAAKAAKSEFFLARVFEDYEKLENINTLGLARYLECNLETLTRLALCGRPTSDDPSRFKSDIKQISQHFNIDADKLASLVRYADTMKGFTESQQLTEQISEQGVLLTARDQEKPSEEKEDVEEEESEEEKKENDT